MKLTDTEFRRRLATVPTCTAIDVLADRDPSALLIRGPRAIQFAETPVAGRARTLRYLPWRDDFAAARPPRLNFELIDSVREGEVLVFDTAGNDSGSVLGDITALRAVQRGAAGVVTDGVVRDLNGLAQTRLPVFASGVEPLPYRGRLFPQAMDVPVQCGRALVCPGDWILADRDAILVLPQEIAALVIQRAGQAVEEEQFTRELLEHGASLGQSFPLTAATRPLYEQYVASGTLPTLAQLEQATQSSGT